MVVERTREGDRTTVEETMSEHRTAVEETKAALRHLVDGGGRGRPGRGGGLRRGLGVDELARAVAVADDPDVRARGERALTAFRRFRAAAAGESPTDHFQVGHDIDLRGGDEPPTE